MTLKPICKSTRQIREQCLSGSPRRSLSATAQLMTFTKNLSTKYGTEVNLDLLKKASEHVKDIVEGDSMNKTFGLESKKKEEFDPRKFYSTEAERTGPATKLKGMKTQTDYLMKKAGMRGIQWGNSVTDDEREFHLEHAADAFKDLADIIGLPEDLISFHGKLGVAFGARGRGNVLAHYEPNLRVINLTRKSGVGSLAHEWGHFFDNVMCELMYGHHDGYASEWAPNQRGVGKEENAKMTEAFSKLTSELMNFKYRMRNEPDYALLSMKRRQYWTSTRELMARAFEKHIQTKLDKAGRKNTYLAGIEEHGFWPNKEETEKLAPLFDSLFESFKASRYIKKARILMNIYELERAL